MLRVVTEADASRRAWQAFRESLVVDAVSIPDCEIGWQGGGVRLDVHWNARTGIWSGFRESPPREGGRFWNCFGVSKPHPSVSPNITVELNPPHFGVNGRTAGVFLQDRTDTLYVGHSGRIGGGRAGIGLKAFRAWSPQLGWEQVRTPTGHREVVVLGPLAHAGFPERFGLFVHAVDAFKAEVVRDRGIW